MYNIKEIKYNSNDYSKELELRDTILRKPLGLSIYNDDLITEKEDLHFGIFNNDELVGCLIISKISENSCRLKQMAIKKDYHRKGLGRKLISIVEEILSKKKINTIIIHARTKVSEFYKKLGYEKIEDEFIEINIPHIKMKKQIKL